MMELGPLRTALFVPGNRPDRVDKAVKTSADAVIIDLEDAVVLTEKEASRPKVRDKILEHAERKIIVRVNRGSSIPKPEKIPSNFGMRKNITTTRTRKKNMLMNTG